MFGVETVFYIIIFFVVFEFVVLTFIDYLNTRNWSTVLPEWVEWIYDEKEYARSMDYEKTKFKLWLISSIFSFVVMFVCIYFWIFWMIFDYIFSFTSNTILVTLLFFWLIMLVQSLISLPFSYYETFVVEEKFAFNKMSKKVFFADNIKSLLLMFVIWGLLLALITRVYTLTPNYFWIIAFSIMLLFSLFSMFFYSTLIVPLFNKQTPLEKWDLRTAIEDFGKKAGFKIDNIFVIDGSKRSSKANAYFTWFGSKKRIVLYDTLIRDLEINELVAVLAHEIWHYKKKHNFQMLAFSVLQSATMFFILGLILKFPEFSYALWSIHHSFALWILAFGIVFTPIAMIFSIFGNMLSRKNEYEADRFAVEYGFWEELASWLKKLSKKNLTNLNPHPFYEFFHYSHPTILKRLSAIRKD